MKYRISGADGTLYGPVDLEQLRQWLAHGRVDERTPVHVEGASTWTYVGLLPELATATAAPPLPFIPAPPAPRPARGTNGFATAGLVCALLSYTCCCCLPISLLGIVFSIIALGQIGSQAEPQEGRMLAIIGLVLSVGSLLISLAAGLLQLVLNPAMVTWQTSQF
jgi:hypothetical protein